MGKKLDYKKTFLIGFGFFGTSVMWALYNTYVPIFLQAGNPAFDSQLAVQTFGFGLSATLTGFIMTLDNIAAFFVQPIMGAISDRTHTRIGRRMPYILICAPIAVAAFAIIPIAPYLIPAELNGQVRELGGLFALFIASLAVMLLAMAVFRTPVVALMPDLTPSPLRSKANGVINLMGGLGGVITFLVGGLLYKLYRPLPFWAGGALTLVAVAILFWRVKEPKELVESAARHEEGLGVRYAVERALERAGVTRDDVGYINPHATSTPAGDAAEVRALGDVFGERLARIPISATKSMLGHLLGGAGGVESVAVVCSLRDQRLHPSINVDQLDPAFALDVVRPGPRDVDVRYALKVSAGFGGHNCVLLFERAS